MVIHMVDTIDMGKLAAEEQAKKASPPAFTSAVSGIKGPSADEEAQMREMFAGVTLENLGDKVTVPAPQGQPPTVQPAAIETNPVQVPQKFLKPDGTVDEEKLKTSSEQLGQAIEKKQKTVDEMLAEYKDQEKQFTELGLKTKQLKETPPNPISEPSGLPQTPITGQTPEQMRQQLLELQQNDPIAFAVEISRAVARKEASDIAAPALKVTARLAEQQRDADLRDNLSALAEKDTRVMNRELYAELMNELNSDPAYFLLKNPMKSAWNEVKERLRLGEPQGLAQPSQTSGPILGRGAPPSVSSLPQPMTRQALHEQVQGVRPFSDDGKKLEEAMRELAESAWRG